MPAGAGTPRYENGRLGVVRCHWCHTSTPWIPAPYRGTGHAFAGMTKGRRELRMRGYLSCLFSYQRVNATTMPS